MRKHVAVRSVKLVLTSDCSQLIVCQGLILPPLIWSKLTRHKLAERVVCQLPEDQAQRGNRRKCFLANALREKRKIQVLFYNRWFTQFLSLLYCMCKSCICFTDIHVYLVQCLYLFISIFLCIYLWSIAGGPHRQSSDPLPTIISESNQNQLKHVPRSVHATYFTGLCYGLPVLLL